MSKLGRTSLALAGLLAAGGVATAASITALSDVEPGRWELRVREGGAAGTGGTHSICVAQPMDLFHVHQPSAGCHRRVLENTARSATVSFRCPGVGQSRTAITVETGRLVQIEAQGVSRGMPFSTSYEARRVGECSAANTAGRRRRAI